jgi:hypothetical protein
MAKMVGTNKAYSMARSVVRPPWGDFVWWLPVTKGYWLPGAVELWVSSVSEFTPVICMG